MREQIKMTRMHAILCETMQVEHESFKIEEEGGLEDFFSTMQNAAEVRQEMQQLVHHYKHAVPFLQPGRIVNLKSHISGRILSSQP